MLVALLRKFRTETAKSPASLLRWIAVTRKHARFDVSADEMFRLGILASQVGARDVKSVTVPVSLGHMGAASVVFISPNAQSIYKRFRENASL